MGSLAPLFAPELPRDREARWLLLDELLRKWFTPYEGTVGTLASELDAAERRLGVRLPVALRDWYERYAGLDHVWCRQDELLAPAAFRISDGLLIFCSENQSVVRWGVRVEDLDQGDPPVFLEEDYADEDLPAECDSVSEFALLFALMNVKWSSALACTANGPANRKALAAVRARYPRLAFPDQHWPPPGPARFYGNEDVILETHNEDWLWVSALTEAAFDEVDTMVKEAFMNWEHVSRG